MKGQPCFVAMQAEGREWTQMFSAKAAALFDYIFTDSMTWTDNHGRRMRLWIPEEVGTIADPQEFMDTLVDRAVGILEHEPIDIYANPTFLPAVLANDYDRLWTAERMERVIERRPRTAWPSSSTIAISCPARPSFDGQGRRLQIQFRHQQYRPRRSSPLRVRAAHDRRVQLVWQDFFVPGDLWPRAIERKGSALRA